MVSNLPKEIEEPMIASWLWGYFDHPVAEWGPEADRFLPVQTLSLLSALVELLSDLELLCLRGSNHGKKARPGPGMSYREEKEAISLLWCVLPHLYMRTVGFVSLPKLDLCWISRVRSGIRLSAEWKSWFRFCFRPCMKLDLDGGSDCWDPGEGRWCKSQL